MKGEARKLLQFMEGSSKRFVIPVYQRNYDWKLENCKQLFDDLEKVVELGRKSHFFGSIVSYFNPDGNDEEYLIIDGQQRLTTISLLLLAMYNLLESGKLKSEKNSLSEQIYKKFLIDEWSDDEYKVKLKPVKNDQVAFEKLFGKSEEHISNSNLTVNYDFFCDKLLHTQYSVDSIFDAIRKLEVIDITLNGDDNPQLIFESLNSTGLALSEGDKIRNYVLMGQPVKLQEKYYKDYWNKIEVNTGYKVSAFIRDYLSLKMNTIPVISKVYSTFKYYVEKTALPMEELLSDITEYSKAYSTILFAKSGYSVVDAALYRLNRLETTVIRPFMMEVFHLNASGVLDGKDIEEIMSTVESYVFRRMICDIPTNALNKIFATLARDVYRLENNYDDFVEKFKYILCNKQDSGEFPDDQQFIESFAKKAVYKLNSKNRVYILERFENFDTVEDKDIYSKCDDGTYSVEHVMPQTLNADWKLALGDDYEEIHESWIHRIGNLTLTAYNSKYSNSKYSDKLNMEHGFKKSGLRLNTYFYDVENWNEQAIKDRTEYLMDQALEIWAKPDSSYIPPEDLPDKYTLADTEYKELGGYKIEKYVLDDVEYGVNTWIAMMVDVINYLYDKDPSILNGIVSRDNMYYEDLFSSFAYEKDKLQTAVELNSGYYVEACKNTGSKLCILRRLFEAYQMDPADLSFYARVDADKAPENINTARVKYWAVLLPVLQEEFQKEKLGTRLKPLNYTCLSTPAFNSGFDLACKMKNNQAYVFLYLGRSRDENKAVFDILYEHKTEIESNVGMELKWYRNNNKKHSRIECVKTIPFTEENYDSLVEFHRTYCRKLYDAVKPYIAI